MFHCANHAGDDSYKSIFKNSWLPYCNYGSYFNKLQRGHILLTPQSNMKERSIDNLIRWFLMIFQESNQPLCPNCGERLLEYTQNKFKRGFKCPNCGFGSSVGRCLKCKRVFGVINYIGRIIFLTQRNVRQYVLIAQRRLCQES